MHEEGTTGRRASRRRCVPPLTDCGTLSGPIWLRWSFVLATSRNRPTPRRVPALATWSGERLAVWRAEALHAAGTVALLAVFLAALLQVGARSYNPFIYFRF